MTPTGSEKSSFVSDVVRATVPRTVRNWLRSPSVSAAWLWDSAKFAVGIRQRLAVTPDWSLTCHPHAYKVAYQAQIVDPEQAEEFRSFLAHCSGTMLLFDIGAHFGVFSLASAHFGGRAIAVDPSPIATRMIERQAALNGFSERIRVVQATVSDTAGVMDMLPSGVFSDGYFKAVKGRPKRELTQTQSMTTDGLAAQFGVPTHIKIDVEGHEAVVLRGAAFVLAAQSPVLFLELHNEMISAEGGDPAAALDLLDQLGYQAFATSGNRITRDAIFSKAITRIVATRTQS